MWREARGGTEDHNDVEEHGGDDEDVGDKEEGATHTQRCIFLK